ncbi:hemolysin activation/secretion protein [Modicisalibacter ilicicola DSM 19980]|uniref:Hemolysin activation/secretion protein n=1 Tax=Modicisalibacter ilicicola DSM 19980 TaxID=1121942 RepID=A0A1M4URT2_9GAMM|nr:ShlB/FhaC/HecB family hemolysin secretion/activation protein [Halomonas ilicicola]SHE59333.1 hemolysin activation/secretion protein [Halomonas ilicicola DSM 19980]
MGYKEKCLNYLGLVALCWWSSAVLAADMPSGTTESPATRNFIREDQQRLLEEQQQKLQELERLPGERMELPSVPTSPEAQCFPVDDIALEGVTLLDDKTWQQLVSPFIDRCLTVSDLNELLRTITQAYIDRGYITTRAYLPQQDLSRKTLRVAVIEGKVEAIESQGDSPTPRELSMASPAEAGDALNLRDLEQLIDQLNRLPSYQATMELVPGNTPGGSRVQIANARQKPWRVTLGHNNGGSDGTGEQQQSAGLEWDSPLGLADRFMAQLGHDASTEPGHGSGNGYLDYSLPYGYWSFSYSYTQSDYRSLAEASGFTFALEGKSERHRLQAERLLARDSVSKTSASVGISRLSTRNYIDGARIEVSSQRLSELDIGLNHGRRVGNAFFNIDAGWQKGLTVFGAQSDSEDMPGTPKAQYKKTTLTLSYLQPFSLFQQQLSFSSLINGQWSTDVLYSPQRLSLGGQSSVRGFKEQSLSGDSGGYWRNQVTWQRPLDVARPVFNNVEASLAYDVGVIHQGRYNPELSGRLSGYAVGFGLRGEHLAANISFAHSLERPDIFEKRETPVYFSVEAFF